MENIFKTNLVFLRESRNEKQSETATALGLSRSTYANYEVGDNLPKADVLLKIIGHFGVSFEKIMSENLQDAHLNENAVGKNLQANAHLNAHLSAHPNEQKGGILPVLNNPGAPYQAHQLKEIIRPVMVTVDQVGRENVIMVNAKARAGYLLGYGDPEYISSLPAYRIPGLNHGTFRAFEVAGQSMYQTLSSADVVIGEYVEQAQAVKDGRVYIFVTKDDGILIKRALNRVESHGKFILKSDNIEEKGLYPNIVLDVEQVVEIWEVKLVLSRQLREPGGIYNRLSELEAKFTFLNQQYQQLLAQKSTPNTT